MRRRGGGEVTTRFCREHHGAAAAEVRFAEDEGEDGDVEVDVGFPVELPAIPADERIHYGQLPAGTYATVLHRGPYDSLVDTTAALLDWAAAAVRA